MRQREKDGAKPEEWPINLKLQKQISFLKNSLQIFKDDINSLMTTDKWGYIVYTDELTQMSFKRIFIYPFKYVSKNKREIKYAVSYQVLWLYVFFTFIFIFLFILIGG